MTDRDREDELLKNVRSALDRSAENLDAATASRIARVRREALESRDAGPHKAWLPAAVAVAASAAVVAVIVARAPEETAPMFEDLELIAAPDDPELYRDLEFYAWLDTHESAG